MTEIDDNTWQELYSRWNIDRLKSDSQRLDEGRKKQIYQTMLVNSLGLTEEEADLFTQSDYSLSAEDPEKLLIYARGEKKIADFFGGGSNQKDEAERVEQKARFKTDVREELTGFYSEQELVELLSLIRCQSDEVFIALFLCAGSYLVRRTRNAYLPSITDLLKVDTKTGEGEIITHELFDGETDAVGQINRLLRIEEN